MAISFQHSQGGIRHESRHGRAFLQTVHDDGVPSPLLSIADPLQHSQLVTFLKYFTIKSSFFESPLSGSTVLAAHQVKAKPMGFLHTTFSNYISPLTPSNPFI